MQAEIISENISDNSGCENSKQNLMKKATFKRPMRSKYMQAHVIVLIILVFGLSSAVAFLSYLYVSENSKRYCYSAECIRSAANLLLSMDDSVDPCDDFYQFACGSWHLEHPIPEHSFSTDWFSDRTEYLLHSIREFLSQNDSEDEPYPVHQARILYRSCLDDSAASAVGITPILEVLNATGLPLLPPIYLNNESKNFSWLKTAVDSKNTFDQDFFISFGITSDLKNRSLNRLYVGKPDGNSPLPVHRNLERLFKLKVRDLLEKEEYSADDDLVEASEETNDGVVYLKQYMTYITSIIEKIYSFLGEDINGYSPISNQTMLKLINFTVHVDKLVTNTYSNSSSSDAQYISLNDLQSMTDAISAAASQPPIINWKEYFSMMFSNANVTLDFDGNESVLLISNLEYMNDIFKLLVSTDIRLIKLYMWWTVVDTLIPYTTRELRDMNSDFMYTLTDHRNRQSRSIHCSDVVNQIMGMAVSYSLVDDFDLTTTEHEVRDMVDNIQLAFRDIVHKLHWMDGKTKDATKKKSISMKTFVGYPSMLLSKDMLEEYYEGLEIEEGEFLRGILNEIQRVNKIALDTLREPYNYDGDSWASDPTDVNAFHWSQANAITIPAGILQFPFYGHGLQALNYGAIGSIVGHEITHGFDNSGKEYDDQGNKNPWWTNNTSKEFKEKTECFVSHYGSYSFVELGGDQVDGVLTLDENIADNGGLREALLAYGKYVRKNGPELLLPGLEKYSHEQLLFLSFANTWCENASPKALQISLRDTHSPNEVRVKGVLSNSREFADTWKCHVGTNMNQGEKKCQIW